MPNFVDNVYPKDLTMTLASNHIEREIKEFSVAQDRIFVPDGGPFFTDSLIIKDNSGNLLVPTLDYKLLYLNEAASIESGRDVVTVIWITSETIPNVILDYRVVGGGYGNTVNAIIQELNKSGPIFKNVDWNIHVYNKPSQFPAAPHYHIPKDFTGWEMVYRQLEGIRKAIIGGDIPAWQAHYNYIRSLFKNFADNLRLELENYMKKDDLRDYYTRQEVDDLLANLKKECCNGNGGGGNGEEFKVVATLEGDEIVYTITSNNPESTSFAPYAITEYVAANMYTLTSSHVGSGIDYTIESEDPNDTSSAPYTIVENAKDTTELYTIASRLSGDNVIYDITSNNPTSSSTANITIEEKDDETFNMASKIVGTNVVYTLTSNNPNSTTSAPYIIEEDE